MTESNVSTKKLAPPTLTPPPGLLDAPVDIGPNGMSVLERRYLRRDPSGKICETPQQMFWRVASTVANRSETRGDEAATDVAADYYRAMSSLEFLPNSPTFTGAGTPLGQLAACFVLAIADDMGKESDDGIFATLKNAALIQQTGGGVGFSFGRLRPKGDAVSTSGGTASGPLSFLRVYDAAFCAIAQGGTRRGANMAVLPVDHPDIEEFVSCKSKEGTLTNFNLSVALTDAFMRAVKSGGDFALVNPRTRAVTRTVGAAALFDAIAAAAHRNGEPGVLFVDAANRGNPVPKLYSLEATNPCGEQWIGPNESCCLGSINLTKFVRSGTIAWDRLGETVRLATRFLDGVIDANAFVPAVPKLREAALRTRRIGLGIMGLADVAFAMRTRYGSPRCLDLFSQIMEFVRFHAMRASAELALVRGAAFPAFRDSVYSGSGATAEMPWKPPTPLVGCEADFGRPRLDWGEVRDAVRGNGLRNAAVTTIAPTGTIGTIAGCEGYGCEPVFALAYTRKVKEGSGDVTLAYCSPAFVAALEEAGLGVAERKAVLDAVLETGSCRSIAALPQWIRDTFVVSGDIPARDHILVQAALQRFVDSSISKTINFPATATVSDVREAYLMAWESGCKGLAIYVTGSRSDVILETKATTAAIAEKTSGEATAAVPVAASPEVGRSPAPQDPGFCRKRPRPDFLSGTTYCTRTPLGNAFITVNGTDDGEPFEVFMNIGRGGSDVAAVSEAMGRLISLILRMPSTVSPTQRLEEVVSQLEGIGGRKQSGFGDRRITSLPDSVARCLGTHAKRACRRTDASPTAEPGDESGGDVELCPECGGSTLIKVGGCHKCRACGHSECQ